MAYVPLTHEFSAVLVAGAWIEIDGEPDVDAFEPRHYYDSPLSFTRAELANPKYFYDLSGKFDTESSSCLYFVGKDGLKYYIPLDQIQAVRCFPRAAVAPKQ